MIKIRQLVITGNVVKDLDLKVSQSSGKSNVSFTVANNDRKENVIFMNVKAFEKTAENCANYLKKGSKVLVVGDFATYEYEKDGQKKYGYEILANRVEFLDSKKSAGDVPSTNDEEDDTPQQGSGKPKAESDIPF